MAMFIWHQNHKGLFLLIICILVVSLLLTGCTKPTIEELIDDLSNSLDLHAREKAVDALIDIGTPAVEPLIAVLASKNINARDTAARALGEIGDARAVKPLIAILYKHAILEEEHLNKESYITALANIGTPSAEALITDLKNEQWQIRDTAKFTLEDIGLPAVEALIVALVDEDSYVRDTAEQLLLDIGAPAVEAIITALDNKHFLIQVRYAEILEDMPLRQANKAAEGFLAPFQLLSSGNRVEKMAAYGGSGPHPIVVLYSGDGGIHQYMYELPFEWVPASIDDIELVACVGEDEWITIETCQYMPAGTVYRKQCQVEVHLIEAQTGSVVADKVFRGPHPSGCREQESFPSGISSFTFYGDTVPSVEIQRWLSTYVED